jgi:hypothetical protein
VGGGSTSDGLRLMRTLASCVNQGRLTSLGSKSNEIFIRTERRDTFHLRCGTPRLVCEGELFSENKLGAATMCLPRGLTNWLLRNKPCTELLIVELRSSLAMSGASKVSRPSSLTDSFPFLIPHGFPHGSSSGNSPATMARPRTVLTSRDCVLLRRSHCHVLPQCEPFAYPPTKKMNTGSEINYRDSLYTSPCPL